MVGRESKGGSVFSWADEVEKEEEEEAVAASEQQKQKPNPFGSARPREVVLQEKGIDWRKFDLHLQQQQPSPLRHESKNEKMSKESNPHPTKAVRFAESPTPTVSNSEPQIIITPQTQIQSPILVFPPLRYPPKYVAGFRYEPGVFTSPNAGYQHFKHEKENRSESEGAARKFHNWKMCGSTRRKMTELVQAKEAQQKSKILGESAVYGNKQEADSSTRKQEFHGTGRNCPGLPLVNQNIGPPETEMQVKRMPLAATGNGRQPRNIQHNLSMDKAAYHVTENKAMEQKWQKVTRRLQDMSARQTNHGGRDTARRKIKGDRAGWGRSNKKKNFEKKEIMLQT
ncbi:hypothetical protein PTKIN_Ptkin12aG0142000 [Pterospermum kingtungense]